MLFQSWKLTPKADSRSARSKASGSARSKDSGAPALIDAAGRSGGGASHPSQGSQGKIGGKAHGEDYDDDGDHDEEGGDDDDSDGPLRSPSPVGPHDLPEELTWGVTYLVCSLHTPLASVSR